MRHREGFRAACCLGVLAMVLAGCEQAEQDADKVASQAPARATAGARPQGPPPASVPQSGGEAQRRVLGGPPAPASSAAVPPPASTSPASAPPASPSPASPPPGSPPPASEPAPSSTPQQAATSASPAPAPSADGAAHAPHPLPIPLPDPLVASISPPGPSAADAQRDARITARVNARLAADPALRTMKVAVETHGGIVTLRGVARTAATLARAGDIAHGVPEVRGVDNEIVLRTG